MKKANAGIGKGWGSSQLSSKLLVFIQHKVTLGMVLRILHHKKQGIGGLVGVCKDMGKGFGRLKRPVAQDIAINDKKGCVRVGPGSGGCNASRRLEGALGLATVANTQPKATAIAKRLLDHPAKVGSVNNNLLKALRRKP